MSVLLIFQNENVTTITHCETSEASVTCTNSDSDSQIEIEESPPQPAASPSKHTKTLSFNLSSGENANVSDSDSDSNLTEVKKLKIDQRCFDYLKYQQAYPWLYQSLVKEGFICKYCELFSVTESDMKKWVSLGVTIGTHPTRQFEKHSNSEQHRSSEKQYVESKCRGKKVPIYQRKLESAQKKLKNDKERNRIVMKKLFQIAYYVVRKYWAQDVFQDLVEFIASLGVADLQQHIETAPPDATYLSTTTVTEILAIIANNLESKQLSKLRSAPFFSLLADESTDEQNREQMTVFAKWP